MQFCLHGLIVELWQKVCYAGVDFFAKREGNQNPGLVIKSSNKYPPATAWGKTEAYSLT